MKTRIALVLSILASLVWAVALPLWVGRYALSSPTFYLHWLREGDVVAQFTAALANELPRQIPEASWWPWLPRSPEKLAVFFDHALATVDIEAALAKATFLRWRWASGGRAGLQPVTPSVALYLRGPYGESLRDFLWRTLPSCDEAAPPACISLDPDTHRAALVQQRAWWAGFVADFIILLGDAESRLIDAWAGPPAWLLWIWPAAPLGALVLMLAAALVMPPGRSRWAAFSVPLLTGGLVVGGVGALATLDRIPPPVLSTLAGTPWRNIWLLLYPALWRAAMRTTGPLLVIGGTFSLALGISFALLIFEGWWSKLLAVTAILLALVGVMWLYPASALAPLSPRAVASLDPTTTPLPTATDTPIPPTATATPVVNYWPVQPGTPVPTPSGAFAVGAQQLGCYQMGGAVAALRVAGDEILALGAATTSQHDAFALTATGSTSNAQSVEGFALSSSGEEIAVADGLDLYVYAFPSWERALRSRVSTFSRIQTLAYVTGLDQQLALGLENGFLWVTEPSTGRIVWLLSTNASPITALAAHPSHPLVLSGSADGKVRLWDMAAGEVLVVLRGHDLAVTHLAFAPQAESALNERAISVDVAGLWTLWDLADQRILRQRRVLTEDELSVLVWTESGIVAGTSGGKLLFVDENFDADVLPVADDVVTALAFSQEGYALVSTLAGQVCVWGTLDR